MTERLSATSEINLIFPAVAVVCGVSMLSGISGLVRNHAELTAATTAKLLREDREHPQNNIK